nr:uncharacterized protein LOC129283178 [Lytechinus pictus]
MTWHLSAVCSQFHSEVVSENGLCNSEVIDEVHDHAENVAIQGYDGDIVEDYLDMANDGLLCYANGLTVRRVAHACDCMRQVCDRYKDVDRCSKIVLSPFAPNTGNGSLPRSGRHGYGPAYNCFGYRCLTISPALVRSKASTVNQDTRTWMMMKRGLMIASVTMATLLR